jgi:methyl-accepting chemotaxis protein
VQLNIKQKLFAIAALAVAGTATLTGVALVTTSSLSDALTQQEVTGTALANQIEMDMMHDALRADVLAAILAVDEDERATVLADVEDHAQLMESLLAANTALDLTSGTEAVLAAVQAPLEAYTASSRDMVALATSAPSAARAQLPAYLTVFEALATSMGDASDAIRAEAEQAVTDAHAGASQARTVLLVAAAVIGGLVGVVVWRVSAGICRRIATMVDALHRAAQMDLRVRVDERGSDEIAAMGSALNRTLASTGGALEQISDAAEHLAAASSQMAATSRVVGGHADLTSTEVGSVAAAANQVSAMVQRAATGTEELGVAVREIAENASQAAAVASEGVEATMRTSTTLRRLGASSAEISGVVDVITSIAEQTNLLALNATIEAARAGEAGRGFAVVANEVKDLAQATARATGDIKGKIETLLADTGSSVSSVEHVVEVIHRINDFQTSIAGAVEEQAATTDEISRAVNEAAGATSGITASIDTVAGTAQETSQQATATAAAATELLSLADELRRLVGGFQLR